MITYKNSSFGYSNLLRVHGSPVYKVLLPTFVSTGLLLIINYLREEVYGRDERYIQHPYVIGAFVGFFGFLLTFRLNFAYGRYWEAVTAVHQMTSKWVDVAILMCAFHYQAESYKDVMPPAFGNHPTAVECDTQRVRISTNTESLEATMEHVQILERKELEQKKNRGLFGMRKNKRSQSRTDLHVDMNSKERVVPKTINKTSAEHKAGMNNGKIPLPLRFQQKFLRASVMTGAQTAATRSLLSQGESSVVLSRHVKMPPPSPFLQELAHLVSLLCAVAMSTLRNDIEGCPPSIVEYIPNQPWPTVDPDDDAVEKKHEYGGDNTFWQSIYFMLGLSRSERHRTLYNAARPFSVLGGISDEEVAKVERARGPYAKTALCFMWLSEFMSRETLHDSVGKCHDALVSRCYQYASDGCVGYYQARKVAYCPFPFPHSQITALFSFIIIFVFPVLFQSYVSLLWFACFLNTFTVLCFLGLHEVARELENPFTNIPNDLPLPTFQAQINEALVTMYAGYHPDSWWTIATPTEPVVAAKEG